MFYYRFASFWEGFSQLWAEVMVSIPQQKDLDDGGNPASMSLPAIAVLRPCDEPENGADYILVPRFTSISKNEYICPEFGGLPDMIRHTLKGLPKLIDTEINMRKSDRGGMKAAIEMGEMIGAGRRRTIKAFQLASQAFRKESFIRNSGKRCKR